MSSDFSEQHDSKKRLVIAGPGFYSSNDPDAYDAVVIGSTSTWYPLATIQKLIKDLKTQNVNTQQGRDAALGLLNSLQTTVPYLMGGPVVGDIRFSAPTNLIASAPDPLKFFIAAYCDGWDIVLLKLRTALDFKERAGERAANANGASGEVDQSKSTPDPEVSRQQRNDTNVAVAFLIDNMEVLIRARAGVYNVRAFETKYNLIWTQTS